MNMFDISHQKSNLMRLLYDIPYHQVYRPMTDKDISLELMMSMMSDVIRPIRILMVWALVLHICLF